MQELGHLDGVGIVVATTLEDEGARHRVTRRFLRHVRSACGSQVEEPCRIVTRLRDELAAVTERVRVGPEVQRLELRFESQVPGGEG